MNKNSFFSKNPIFQDRFLRFSYFRFCGISSICKIFSKKMLVRYRGINNKGVLDGPWTKWRVWEPFLVLWNASLSENVEKWTFRCHVRPNRAKNCCAVFVRSVRSPWTPPDLPNFNLNYEKTAFVKNPNFANFPNPFFARDGPVMLPSGFLEDSLRTPQGLPKDSFRMPSSLLEDS